METITAPLCDNFSNAPRINWTHAKAVGAQKSDIVSCFVFISSLSHMHANREQIFGFHLIFFVRCTKGDRTNVRGSRCKGDARDSLTHTSQRTFRTGKHTHTHTTNFTWAILPTHSSTANDECFAWFAFFFIKTKPLFYAFSLLNHKAFTQLFLLCASVSIPNVDIKRKSIVWFSYGFLLKSLWKWKWEQGQCYDREKIKTNIQHEIQFIHCCWSLDMEKQVLVALFPKCRGQNESDKMHQKWIVFCIRAHSRATVHFTLQGNDRKRMKWKQNGFWVRHLRIGLAIAISC